MNLEPGHSLLHYRIVDKIGEGGMGVVWKATDTRLGREVAIKLLPERFAADPPRLERFRREARAMASLNHPNIVTIHGVEHEGRTPFLVMEYVPGTVLSASIPAEGMEIGPMLDLAVDLAGGLAEAHRNGVTHRDLKPDNVIFGADGRPKILDFGLARLIDDATSTEGRPAEVETRTAGGPVTAEGAVLGTTAYMSPEQVEGQVVDSRSDLFSFGVMLYEIAVGRRPFEERTTPRLMSAILSATPRPVRELRADLPAELEEIIERCLRKEPDARFRSASELYDRLRALRDTMAAPRASQRRVGIFVLGGAVLLLAAALIGWMARSRRDAGSAVESPLFAARSLSQLTFEAATEQWPAWSPDGSRIVFSREVDGFANLFLQEVPGGTVRRLTTGSRDDVQATWSPDASSILFVRAGGSRGKLGMDDALVGSYIGGDVYRLEVETGEDTRILENAYNPALSPDGQRLAVDASWAGPRRIWITDARGNNPRQVTSGASEEIRHSNPAWSPDGKHIVYQHAEKTKQDIHAIDVTSGAETPVTDDLYLDLDPVWSATGAVLIASYRGGGLNIWRVPVRTDGTPTGPPEQLTTGAGQDLQPTVTADGTAVAFTVLSQNADLWRLPTDPATGAAAGPAEPFVASTREDSRGAWSPDGKRLAFNSDRDGAMNLWLFSPEEGATVQLTHGQGGDYQPAWSQDGSRIAFFSARAGNADVWVVDVASGELVQVTEHPALDTNPAFAPDGLRIAFQSDRDGRKEVWLVDLADKSTRRLTTVGASDHFLRWSPDGRYVYFRSNALRSACRVEVGNGEVQALAIGAGWHMSFSPDRSLLLDVLGHRSLSVFPLDGSPQREVFAAVDPAVRIDYPSWSPDGRWVVFDRVIPQGGDVWRLQELR